MNFQKYPSISLAISFGIGVLVQRFWNVSFSLLIVFLTIQIIGLILLYWKEKIRFFGFLSLVTLFSLGVLNAKIHNEKDFKTHYSNQKKLEKNLLQVTVKEALKPNKKFKKYFVELSSLNHQKAKGKLLLNYASTNKKIVPGQTLLVFTNFVPITKSLNPNQFDYASYLEKNYVYHQIYVDSSNFKLEKLNKNFDYYTYLIREKLSNSFAIHSFSETTLAIVNALLLGQKQEMDKELIQNYSNAGVIHVLAISGLHIGIIYAFLNLIFRFLNYNHRTKILKLILIVSLLWVFALISGMSPSVSRAVTMFTFVAIGHYYNRKNSLYNAMAVSFLILLFIRPNNLFDVGFQLSYCAVLSIILFQPFYKKFYFTKNKIVVYFIDIVLVSLVAQLGVLPLSIYYFKQIPLLFLMANLVVIPLSSLVLIIGIITLVFNFLFEPIAIIFGKVISFFIEKMNEYIQFIASFENGIIKNVSFSVSLTIATYFVIASFIFVLYKNNKTRWILFLCALVVFQITFMLDKESNSDVEELIVFHSKETMITKLSRKNLEVYCDSISDYNQTLIENYSTSNFIENTKKEALKNTLFLNGNKVLILDSLGIYKTKIKPNIIILTQKSKVNLDRLIKEINPKIIVANGSNSNFYINQWKTTCMKRKIPFHATADKGYYRLK